MAELAKQQMNTKCRMNMTTHFGQIDRDANSRITSTSSTQ